ncbi:hypothetical protein CAOG_01384 [Capsaspora owczarzaki ATCC 30864]|uniref:BD-FAE-like domain-containing protein n=1 Tax=Capsaspora owczarzaki (strain ATCC 30864) TaxID=595528 RepID=A0A0D2WJ34_CAPO3|nr:hypothetical protein CAOG_01384 [Capsaspora owczarzaki ATCC 30864]KJE89995.1 hypothetical protein CAOG_001384 [Capsaspora owczarzaki ATCC 30864]|eukprot:XP_004349904.1 hypothetical protein CAOG_01384 [Capsaspora owczarzaki ATCC 30864]
MTDTNRAVYRTFNIKELDFQYSPSQWSIRGSPDEVINKHVAWLVNGSDRARKVLAESAQLNVRYSTLEAKVAGGGGGGGAAAIPADSSETALDLFFPPEAKTPEQRAKCPLVIYIHGGYWQFLNKDASSFMAENFCKHGLAVAAIGYTLAPAANIFEIIHHTRLGVALAHQLCPGTTAHLIGHSAGGHLAAMCIATSAEEWQAKYGVPAGWIRSATLVSGVFDLRPITMVPSVNDAVRLTMADAQVASPLLLLASIPHDIHVIVAVGRHDPEEFRRQSREFHDNLVQHRGNITDKTQFVYCPEDDHFEAIEKLSHADFCVTQAVFAVARRV